MTSGTNPPPGTIRLTSVAAEWAEHEYTNPRFLASGVAAFLRTLPPAQLLDPRIVTPALFDPVTGPGGFTAAALADYFEGVSQGTPPPTIRTSTGTAPTGAVLIARSWVNRATKEAAQRAAFVAGLVLIANDGDSLSMIVGGTSSTSSAPAAPPSGSEPGYLQMRQSQQRLQGERSAAEQLDTERAGRQRADTEAATLRGMLAAKDAEITRLREAEQQNQQALNDTARALRKASDDACALEEQLESVMGLAEFMNADNPLSPPDGRELVECWRALTQDGVTDPTKATGNGWHTLCGDWLNKHTELPSEIKRKRFAALLTPLASKKGGTLPTPRK